MCIDILNYREAQQTPTGYHIGHNCVKSKLHHYGTLPFPWCGVVVTSILVTTDGKLCKVTCHGTAVVKHSEHDSSMGIITKLIFLQLVGLEVDLSPAENAP